MVVRVISDDFFDLMRIVWQQSIPEQFRARLDDKEWRGGGAHSASSLCAPVPKSSCKNDKLFDRIKRHLTKQQLSELGRRERIASKAATKKAARADNTERTGTNG